MDEMNNNTWNDDSVREEQKVENAQFQEPAQPKYQQMPQEPAQPQYQQMPQEPAQPQYQQMPQEPAQPQYQQMSQEPAQPQYQQTYQEPVQPQYQQPYQEPSKESPFRVPPMQNQYTENYYNGNNRNGYYGNPGPQQQYQQPQYSYIPNIPGNPEPVRKPKKERKKNGNGWKIGTALLCIVCLCGSIFGGVNWSSMLKNENGGRLFGFPANKETDSEQKDVTDLQDVSYESIADIAEDVGKSVVTIVTTVESQGQGFSGSVYSSEALGSGVIIGEKDNELYIATNYHVIEGATAVSVLIGNEDPEVIDAYYKGSDSSMDLAVIYVRKSEISEETLKAIKIATLGESDEVKLGDLAIAIGSPIDKSYSNTVTTGIISGLERNVTFENEDGTAQTLVLLQTDAAINPGNSGGALVNGRGEVIGINNAKIVASDVEGMGFALPMSTVKPLLEELINNGKVIRPYLGITGSAIESGSEFATYYNLINGIYIVSVMEGGPAQLAGIQADDVLISFNGKTLITFEDLTTALNECEIGQEVEIELIRGYAQEETKTLTVKLIVAEKPGDHE